jgi:hypothetical protein
MCRGKDADLDYPPDEFVLGALGQTVDRPSQPKSTRATETV